MKTTSAIVVTLSLVASSLQLTTPAAADRITKAATPVKEESPIDCSKEVWPHFSPSCIRNANRSIEVRLVKTTRR